MKITEEGYLLTKEEWEEYQSLKSRYNFPTFKKKENITVEISPHRTPKHLLDIEKFLNQFK
jgi:hypothetical protein